MRGGSSAIPSAADVDQAAPYHRTTLARARTQSTMDTLVLPIVPAGLVVDVLIGPNGKALEELRVGKADASSRAGARSAGYGSRCDIGRCLGIAASSAARVRHRNHAHGKWHRA